MAIKDLLYRFRPNQLYVVLILSICYFSLQMVLSHMTHGLTLLMASYHMLCNIFALTGCILTMKHTNSDDNMDYEYDKAKHSNTTAKNDEVKFTCVNLSAEEQSLRNIEFRERKLRNTFGWARIDVLTMLIVCIFLASLSFSLLVEALQTLIHIDHQDSMHLPVSVLILGFIGLILNGLCYLLIGGYTMHQGSFLHMTTNGDVILDNGKQNNGELTDGIPTSSIVNNLGANDSRFKKEKQSLAEMFRDVSSSIFVIICAAVIYMSNDEHTAKFIDPTLSIFSCVVLVTLSYPYMKESCLILLQTIPGSIDIDIFEKNLGTQFPEIISYHDLHIWQLTSNKYVSTVHIKFKSQQLYTKIIDDVRYFFMDQGITIVTIQPEFQDFIPPGSFECLVQCNTKDCLEKVCCQQSRSDLLEIASQNDRPAESSLVKGQRHNISTPLNTNIIAERSQSAINLTSYNSIEIQLDSTCNSTERKNKILTTTVSSSPNISFTQ